MSNEKIRRVQDLRDEVRDFHPVLQVLLRKLPNVLSVEYRQGPREMGADFVVERQDPTLLSTEYAGVIVKVGKILQNHAEVERQVEECELERTYSGGKKKIFLSEIWVISNDSISQGAQDKINHKYKNKSIKFIPGEKVVDLLNNFYAEYWTDISVALGEYFRSVTSDASLLSSGSALLGSSHNDIYVNQSLILAQTSKDYRSAKRTQKKKITFSAALKSTRFLIVESSMGTGKSTMLAVNAVGMACPEAFSSTQEVPVLATVKEVRQKYADDLSLLVADVKRKVGVNGARYIVMLDGLDELNLAPEKQLELLGNLKNSIVADDSISLVVATRPLAADSEAVVDHDFIKYALLPFSVTQVIKLVNALCKSEEVEDRLTRDLEKSELFKVLPKTPISAILLAKLLKENVHEIPSTMTELYHKYMELVMGRWDMSKGLQSQTEYEVIFNVTISLARYVIDNSLDLFSVAEAKEMFADYVGSRNLSIDADSTFKRMLSREEVFSTSGDRCVMSFRHRTFAEFFYAAGLDREGGEKLQAEVFEPYWSTVYFFYFGLKRDAEKIVSEVSEIPLIKVSQRFNKLMAMPNMMLASYLTPYRVITAAVRLYFHEASQLYIETIELRDSDSPLASFSQIDLLCICTRIISSKHAYEFFKAALLECAEDLYSKPGDRDEIELVELFFLSSALASIGYAGAYGTLIDSYGPRMPLALRVGVIEHSDEAGLKSDLITRYGKRLHKSFKTNPEMSKSLKVIMDQPISSVLKNGDRSRVSRARKGSPG